MEQKKNRDSHVKEKELLYSLSKEKGDFIIQPFKGSGKGGQKRNKTMSCARIIHPASGSVSECQEERSFDQNKKKAFKRLIQSDKFQQWHRIESARRMGRFANIEDEVNREMQNVKIEVVQDGKWVEVSI